MTNNNYASPEFCEKVKCPIYEKITQKVIEINTNASDYRPARDTQISQLRRQNCTSCPAKCLENFLKSR